MLKADTEKKIKAVCVVHNETTTGVTSDIAEVRRGLWVCSCWAEGKGGACSPEGSHRNRPSFSWVGFVSMS